MEASTLPNSRLEAQPRTLTTRWSERRQISTVAQRPEVLWGSEALAWLNQRPFEKSAYWRAMLGQPTSTFASNYRARTGLVVDQGQAHPITVTDRPDGNAYPSSLHAQYITYPLTELHYVKPRLVRSAALAGLHALRLPLRIAEVD